MDSTQPKDHGWIVDGPSPDGVPTLTDEEAEAEEAKALLAYKERRVISNDRMQDHIDALFKGYDPDPPKPEAEVNRQFRR